MCRSEANRWPPIRAASVSGVSGRSAGPLANARGSDCQLPTGCKNARTRASAASPGDCSWARSAPADRLCACDLDGKMNRPRHARPRTIPRAGEQTMWHLPRTIPGWLWQSLGYTAILLLALATATIPTADVQGDQALSKFTPVQAGQPLLGDFFAGGTDWQHRQGARGRRPARAGRAARFLDALLN